MNRDLSPKSQDLVDRVQAFFDQHITPNEARYEAEMHALRAAGNPWQVVPLIEESEALDLQNATETHAQLWAIFDGVAVGLLLGRSETLARIFEPYIVAFNSLPRVALVPLIIMLVTACL